eukprot:TRINITY_DN350_c0_g2_i5.p1 TRINITY_DN350_c0_g2~~TRINITY_DN350_c0_g2_i5.p1  ORF type:complete len:1561 (+),score=580.71 TRINITY_DN350_c0_g2_i5:124-4806(+)
MTNLHRSTCWLASKCASQLVSGSALQQVLLADEEQKFNYLLNSKLFSGGMEKCYFTGGKEPIWQHIYDIMSKYEAGHLAGHLSSEMTAAEKEEEKLLNDLIDGGESNEEVAALLAYLQKQFARECLWASLGGEAGAKVVRAAFAVIVKHAGLTFDVRGAIADLTLPEVLEGKPTPGLKNLGKKWAAASRMRTWLVEKRKEIDDMAERNKHLSTARKNTKLTSEPTSSKPKEKAGKKEKKERDSGIRVRGRRGGRGGAKKNVFEDVAEEAPPKQEEEVEPQVQEPIQIKDTEEIIEKMIAQMISKAKFLTHLIPAKHWSTDRAEDNRKEKQLLFRQSSQIQADNTEDDWKRRLQQWKSVRQSKQVIKSLEEEAHEIHLSLTTSVLVCLQSSVSIRRLRKQVESAYLRAICRTIGFNVLTSIIHEVPSSLFRQDVVGWLCSSLRGNENKLYHFSDNLQGCGHFLESAVNTAFKKLILGIVRSMAPSNEADEIKSMLEGLKWRYHGDDLTFLAEIDLFNILKGSETQTVLRNAWGKAFAPGTPLKHDLKLVRKLLELFEIVTVLCVSKIHGSSGASHAPHPPVEIKKDKLPVLERNVSAVDESSAEVLVRQAFSVIFSELDQADQNYRSANGIDWGAYLRAKRREEQRKESKKDKKGKKRSGDDDEDEDYAEEGEYEGEGDAPRRRRSGSRSRSSSRSEESDEEEGSFEEEEEKRIEPEEDEKQDDDGDDQDKIDEIAEEPSKPEKKEDAGESKKRSRKERIREMIEREERLIQECEKNLYNPEFLQRLIALLYRCVQSASDHVIIDLGYNAEYLGILLSLLKSAPPQDKMLIVRILSFALPALPVETVTNGVVEAQKRLKLAEGKVDIVQFIFGLLVDVRKRWFTENIEYQGEYTFTCELVSLLRILLGTQSYSNAMKEIVKNALEQDIKDKAGVVGQLNALAVLGGEVLGLRTGAKLLVTSQSYEDILENNVLLALKRDPHFEYATALGFTAEYKEKVSEEEKKKEKEKYKHDVRLNPDQKRDALNPVALIHSSLSKDITSLAAVELTMLPRFNLVCLDSEEPQPSNFALGENTGLMRAVFEKAIDPKTHDVRDARTLMLRSLIFKVLNAYLQDKSALELLLGDSSHDLVGRLLTTSNQIIITGDNLVSLELCEEKLFRLLKQACETRANLDDLENITATVRNNELEVLLGRDLSSLKYLILSAYNLRNVTKYYPVLHIPEPEKYLDTVPDAIKSVENKLILVPESALQNEVCADLLLASRGVITTGFDMQSFAEEYEEVNPSKTRKEPRFKKSRSPLLKGYDASPTISFKKLRHLFKLNALINVTDRAYAEIARETETQHTKEHKNVFMQKRLIDELTECGFPRDLCEKYLEENPSVGLDIIVPELARLVEERNTGKTEEKTKIKVGKGKNQREFMIPMALPPSDDEEEEEDAEDGEKEKKEGEEEDETVGMTAEELEALKEEPNSCFTCKGEKDVAAAVEAKNKSFDDLVAFDTENRVSVLITFKLTNFNFAIFYARRCLLTVLEQWPEGRIPPFANPCLLYTSPSPRDRQKSRMPSSA